MSASTPAHLPPATAPLPTTLSPYDAILLVSFGGPEKPQDVVPFLENVTRGRGIPRDRLAQVGEHYYLFGGRSPINDQCRMLLSALRAELDSRDLDLPLYWGNRNWDPYLTDVVQRLYADGHHRVLAIMTSAYPSYSSCRQYRENLSDAARPITERGDVLAVDRLRHYASHPGFVTASVEATLAALGRLGDQGAEAALLFVTHSIPSPMAETSGPGSATGRSPVGAYVQWHQAVATEVSRQVSRRTGRDHACQLVYCSRSGSPAQPWLEPDVNDQLEALAAAGTQAVVLVPIGFVSDHMEVIYDLDTEAAETAERLGLGFARAATAGTHPAFVSALVDLAVERAQVARIELGVGSPMPEQPVIPGGQIGHYRCPADCCPNLRDPDHPALCGR